jgi:hypothetical protein
MRTLDVVDHTIDVQKLSIVRMREGYIPSTILTIENFLDVDSVINHVMGTLEDGKENSDGTE